MAGSRAKAKDKEASDEDSGAGVSWPACAVGFSRLRASSRLYSEKLELRRGSPCGRPSLEASERLAGDFRCIGQGPSSVVLERRSAWPGGARANPVVLDATAGARDDAAA